MKRMITWTISRCQKGQKGEEISGYHIK
jgi:hypothetical protein